MWYKQPSLLEQRSAARAIEEIYETLPLLKKRLSEFGLTNGYLGLSVFCYLYGLHSGKKSCLKESAVLFQKALSLIGKHPIIYPLDFTELVGVSQFLYQAGVLNDQPGSLLKEIDACLLGSMRQAVDQVDIGGFSCGAVAFGFYFLSRARLDPDRFKDVINELATGLVACSVNSQRECHWYPDQTFPVSLWNGQAAVILFLAAAAEQGYIEKDQVCQILSKAVSFLTHRLMLQPASKLVSFQMGDLGIGYAMLRVGQVFDNHLWCESGLEVLGRRAGFCLASSEAVKHAGILTGASGAAMAFDKIYRLTGNDLFGVTAEMCFNLQLSLYLEHKPEKTRRYTDSALCFGTGSVGVGVGLIKSLHRDEIDFDPLLWLV